MTQELHEILYQDNDYPLKENTNQNLNSTIGAYQSNDFSLNIEEDLYLKNHPMTELEYWLLKLDDESDDDDSENTSYITSEELALK